MAALMQGRLLRKRTAVVDLQDDVPVPEKKTAKSGAQRAKEHYERLKSENPEKYREKLDNQKILNKRRKEHRKLHASEEEIEADKKKHRESMQKYRKNKKEEANSKPVTSTGQPPKRLTRKDVEKVDERRRKDRDRKRAERADQSSQKKCAERNKARKRYHDKKGTGKETDQEAEIDIRSKTARYQAVHRVSNALPKTQTAKQQTIQDFLSTKNVRTELASGSEDTISIKSLTEVILGTCGTTEEDRAFKRLLALKLAHAPQSTSRLVRTHFKFKTNHVVSKANKSYRVYKTVKDPLKANKVRQFFFDNSRILPLKRGAARSAKRILEISLRELHLEFTRAHGPVSFSFFCKNRPKTIRTHLHMKLNQALCEICENLTLKLKAIDNADLGKSTTEFLRRSLCPTDGPFYKKACIDRTCKCCDSAKLREIFSDAEMKREVAISEWAMVDVVRNGKNMKKKGMVRKMMSVGDALEWVIDQLESFPRHHFKAKWQYRQYLDKKKNLKEGELLATLDFAENFRCQNQDEAQSAHWNYQQVTLHPIVFNYICGCKSFATSSIIIVSDDLTHDSSAVDVFTSAALQHVNHLGKFSKFIQFTDGCASQYKSKQPFFDIKRSGETFGLSTERHFFGSRHGKNPSDGEAAVIKSKAMRTIKCRQESIQTPKEFCQFGEKVLTKEGPCCHYLRKFIFVSTEAVQLKRDTRQADSHLIKPIVGTRDIQVVMPHSDGLRHRTLSCFCEGCESGYSCRNAAYVDEWQYFQTGKGLNGQASNNGKVTRRGRSKQKSSTDMDELSTSTLDCLNEIDLNGQASNNGKVTRRGRSKQTSSTDMDELSTSTLDFLNEIDANQPVHAYTAIEPQSTEPIAHTSPEQSPEPIAHASPEQSREPIAHASPEQSPEPIAHASTEQSPEPIPIAHASPEQSPEPIAHASPEQSPEPIAHVSTEQSPEPIPIAHASPEQSPEPIAHASPEQSPEPIAHASPEQSPEPIAHASPEQSPEPIAHASTEQSPEPIAHASPEQSPEPIPIAHASSKSTAIANTSTEVTKAQYRSLKRCHCGSWVIATFPGKRAVKYLGQILAVEDNEAKVKFCRKTGRSFTWPNVDDIGWMALYALHVIEAPQLDSRERIFLPSDVLALF